MMESSGAKKEEQQKETKEVIKAILSSVGKSCTINELKTNFQAETGESIESNIRKLFGTSLLKFLKSKECRTICEVSSNGTTISRISTLKSKHLDNLTKAKQRKNRFKKSFDWKPIKSHLLSNKRQQTKPLVLPQKESSTAQKRRQVKPQEHSKGDPSSSRKTLQIKHPENLRSGSSSSHQRQQIKPPESSQKRSSSSQNRQQIKPPESSRNGSSSSQNKQQIKPPHKNLSSLQKQPQVQPSKHPQNGSSLSNPASYFYPPPITFETMEVALASGHYSPEQVVSSALEQNSIWYNTNLRHLDNFVHLRPKDFKIIYDELTSCVENVADIYRIYHQFVMSRSLGGNNYGVASNSVVMRQRNVDAIHNGVDFTSDSIDSGFILSPSEISKALASELEQLETDPQERNSSKVKEEAVDRPSSKTLKATTFQHSAAVFSTTNELDSKKSIKLFSSNETQGIVIEVSDSDDDVVIVGTSRFTKGECLLIHVIVVDSPSRFWFQVDQKSVHRLMSEIQKYYTKPESEKLQIDLKDLKQGLHVAAEFVGIWHRALVTSDPDENGFVKITFIDFGSRSEIHYTKVCSLPLKFQENSPKAIEGRLSGVKSRDPRSWSAPAIEAFRRSVANKCVAASVVNYNDKENILEMKIYSKDSTNVGAQLIQKGFANASN